MADKRKYFAFLEQILEVPSLSTWDPADFAPKLSIDGVITADELERIKKEPTADDRRIVSNRPKKQR